MSAKNLTFQAYVDSIDSFNASQSNKGLLDAIRNYNHQIIDELQKIHSISNVTMLDIGASPHGYAMEKCFALNVRHYVGIGLDITDPIDIRIGDCTGSLRYMNAESLSFEDDSFDVIVSMSTFEHIADVPQALREMHRVLRPGGSALLSFEPIWTCSYGHHLHHFGGVSDIVPDWSHLLWSREEMTLYLQARWPVDAPLSLFDAMEWVYERDGINRVGIDAMRTYFQDSPLQVEWVVPMENPNGDPGQLALAVDKTGLRPNDLQSKGLTVLLTKKRRPTPPPLLSSTAIWSPIPPSTEIGREEAIYGRTDHQLPA